MQSERTLLCVTACPKVEKKGFESLFQGNAVIRIKSWIRSFNLQTELQPIFWDYTMKRYRAFGLTVNAEHFL